MAGKMIEATDATFNTMIESRGLVLVDFWAPWCGPCRRLNPVLEELSTELDGELKVLKLNTDDNPDTAMRFGVMSIPTMILFKDGQKVDQLIGAHPKENILAAVRKHS